MLFIGCEANKQVKLESDQAKASYALGQNIGRNFSQQQVEIDVPAFAKGMETALKGEESLLSKEDMDASLKKVQENITEKMKADSETNLADGKAFLEKNKSEEGVKVTESGLQYKVLKKGDGPKPSEDDTVVAHYTGVLIDGTKFDSSFDRGEPAEFPVKGVIPGWQEALQMMSKGSVWKLYIPSQLAYGDTPRPGIPANSVLVFDVELIDIKKK